MASKNETVAEIVREMFEYPKSWGEYNHLDWKALAKRIQEALDRILAAHKRALAANDDARLTVVAIYENVIAAKDREIAELRERIKVADYALTELQTRLVSSVYDGTMNPYEALEITERAIAAISEKGGAK